MTVTEPELITIIEGPTPEFHPSPHGWLQSIHEGPDDKIISMTQLRTRNGQDIMSRSERAWQEGRTVQLDFPDELRMRKRVNVIALRLQEFDEGPLLRLWVSLPLDEVILEEDFDDDSEDDDGLVF